MANASTNSGLNGQTPAPPSSGVYSLKWNSFQSHLANGVKRLLDDDEYTDVTLACDGQFIRAHKFLLSLCSPFFKKLFQVNNKGNENTIVILNNVRFKDLENITRFIYNGQTNVSNADLPNFLQTGELLQIEGLSASSSTEETVRDGDGEDNGMEFAASSTAVSASSTTVLTERANPIHLRTRPAQTDRSNKTQMTRSTGPPRTKQPRLAPPALKTVNTSSSSGPVVPKPIMMEDSLIGPTSLTEEPDPLDINDLDVNYGLHEPEQSDEQMIVISNVKTEQLHVYDGGRASGSLGYHESHVNEDLDNMDEYMESRLDQTAEQGAIYDNNMDPKALSNDVTVPVPGSSRGSRTNTSTGGARGVRFNLDTAVPNYNRTNRSVLWNHFKSYLIQQDGEEIELVQCIYCPIGTGQYLQGKKCNKSTGNMKVHLLRHHPEIPETPPSKLKSKLEIDY